MIKLMKKLEPFYKRMAGLTSRPMSAILIAAALGLVLGLAINNHDHPYRICMQGYSHVVIDGKAYVEADNKGLHLPCQINPKLAK